MSTVKEWRDTVNLGRISTTTSKMASKIPQTVRQNQMSIAENLRDFFDSLKRSLGCFMDRALISHFPMISTNPINQTKDARRRRPETLMNDETNRNIYICRQSDNSNTRTLLNKYQAYLSWIDSIECNILRARYHTFEMELIE